MALCQTVRREELMEVQRRLIDCQHENVALKKRNGELQATVFELNKWKSDISDIAAEADADFQLQKKRWDDERLALDQRNNSMAEERIKLHHDLCTAKENLGDVKRTLQSKTQELNNLTIDHREFVLQHKDLPDKVLSLNKQVADLQAEVDGQKKENEKLRSTSSAKNADLEGQIHKAHAELEILQSKRLADADKAARALATAEASYNNELARIAGERMREQELAKEELAKARQEAFSERQVVEGLESQLEGSHRQIDALEKGAEKIAESMKQLQSKLDNTQEQQRVSHKEAIIARQEAEKARAKRDEAVANLQSATAAAADGGEEAMRVIHEYNVAAQKQEEREQEIQQRLRDLDAREADLRKSEAATAARAAELEAEHKEHVIAAAVTAGLKCALQADQAALAERVEAHEKAMAVFKSQQQMLRHALAALDATGGHEGKHAENGVTAGSDGCVGEGAEVREERDGLGDVSGLMARLQKEREEQGELQRRVQGLQKAKDAAQQELARLRREELEAQSKVRGARAAVATAEQKAAAAQRAAELAEERKLAAEAAAPPAPSPVVAEAVPHAEAEVTASGEEAGEEAETVSGILGTISPLLGRLGWGGQTRASASSKAPVSASTQPPKLPVPASPVEFSVPRSGQDEAAPTPQLGHAVPKPVVSSGITGQKRHRAALHSQGSGRGSGEGEEAAGSADLLGAERGNRTRRRVQKSAAADTTADTAVAADVSGGNVADGVVAAAERREDENGGVIADALNGAAREGDRVSRAAAGHESAEPGEAQTEAQATAREHHSETAPVMAPPPSTGKSKVSGKKVRRKGTGVVVRDTAPAAEGETAGEVVAAADAESLVPGMDTPLAEPLAAGETAFGGGPVGSGDGPSHKVTPPTIRTVRLSQVATTGGAKAVGAGKATPAAPRTRRAPASAPQRPRRAAAVAAAAEAADPATPSASGGAPPTPGGQRHRRVARRVQELLQEAAQITGRTPSELAVDDDGAPASARVVRSVSRAASKAGKESSVVEEGEEVQGGARAGHEAAHEAETEKRKLRWRRTQTGTLRTPSQILPYIDEEDNDME